MGSGGRGGLGDGQLGCLELRRSGGDSRRSVRHIREVTWVAEKVLCYSISQSFSTATSAGVNGGSGEMTDTMSLSPSCVDNTGVVPPVFVFDAVLFVCFAAIVACNDEVTKFCPLHLVYDGPVYADSALFFVLVGMSSVGSICCDSA